MHNFSDKESLFLRIRRTIKFFKFVNNPIGIKPVECLPGIGDTFGQRLRDKGFGDASQVLEQFLKFNREERFTNWLTKTCKCQPWNHWQMIECYDGLNEWYRQHFKGRFIINNSISCCMISLFPDVQILNCRAEKLFKFVNYPIGIKTVECLPGIGNTFGEKLRDKGFKYAYQVLGKFLEFDRDEELFTDWLGKMCCRPSNHWQMVKCYDGLNKWYRQHFESKCISSYSIMFLSCFITRLFQFKNLFCQGIVGP